MKTPIKSKNTFYSASAIDKIVPANSKISTALFFSGQIELELAFMGREVDITTNKWVIYEFWDCMVKNPYVIADMADSLHDDLNPHLVYVFQQDWPKFKDPNFRSSLFFILNKYSIDGTISHGSFNTDLYSPLSSRSMINFCESHPVHKLNLRYLRHDNWEDSLPLLDGVLLLPLGDYIVGPLNSKALSGYETYNINHRKLTSLLNSTGKDFILVYKYNRNIFKNFKNYNIAMVNSIGEFTKDYKAAEDVIITNLDINVN